MEATAQEVKPTVLMWKYSQALPTFLTDQQIFHSVFLPSLLTGQASARTNAVLTLRMKEEEEA